MSFSVTRWFQETIIDRARRIFWTRFAAEMETDALLDYAEQLNRIEVQALEYDAQGKTNLASLLRARAAEISPENPIATAERAAKLLAEAAKPSLALPEPKPQKPTPEKSRDKPIVRENRRGRPAKAVTKPGDSASAAELVGREPDLTQPVDGKGV